MEKISVIIPVYNVEEYIKQTVMSVLEQDYENIEIIIVDDGSTDQSSMICDEFLSLDKRICVFHKKNGGLSDARNYGVLKSTGEYITFIDGDDVISTDYISYLYNLIKKNNSDISTCGLNFVKDYKEIQEDNIEESICCDSVQAINMMLYRKYVSHSACGKLFKANIFKCENSKLDIIKTYYSSDKMKFCPISDNILAFPIGVSSEDFATIYVAFLLCDKIEIGYSKKYYYINRQSSIMHKKLSEWNFHILDIIDAVENVIQHYDVNKDAFYEMKMSCYLQLMKRILFEGFNTNLRYQERIMSFITSKNNYKFNSGMRLPTRVRFNTLRISKKAYFLLCNLENRLGSKS